MSEAVMDDGNGRSKALPLAVIRPPSGRPGMDFAELWRFRSILFVLARRHLLVRYRQTLIGAAWAIVQPVSLMLVFTLFFGFLARMPSDGLPYPVFFLTGLVIWQMVNKILNEGSTSVVANAALVGRVYFPRSYFPLSVALASLVDLVIGLLTVAVVLVSFGVLPQPVSLLLVPVACLIAWTSALGVALALSAINTAYRDVTQLLPFLAQVWMFGSPIIYPSSLIPDPIRTLYFLNPIALAVDVFRHAVANTPAPPIEGWVVGLGATLCLLIFGFWVFRVREPTFADVI